MPGTIFLQVSDSTFHLGRISEWPKPLCATPCSWSLSLLEWFCLQQWMVRKGKLHPVSYVSHLFPWSWRPDMFARSLSCAESSLHRCVVVLTIPGGILKKLCVWVLELLTWGPGQTSKCPGKMVDCGSCSYLSAFNCGKIVFQGLLDFSLPIATSMWPVPPNV